MHPPLDTLSRLKGIETFLRYIVYLPYLIALDTLSRLKGIETCLCLSYQGLSAWEPLDTLSRLKGIETLIFLCERSLLLALDTLSRLKGIETFLQLLLILYLHPLDTLSRLKGIETWPTKHDNILWYANFGYAFPFEGN